MASKGMLDTFTWKRPESLMAPRGFALDAADPETQAINRFGLPTSKEPAVTPRSRARDLLQAAAEIEHGLLVQYLYAAYSTKDQDEWRQVLVNIAVQEMDHLICVQNLLLLIGEPPYFDRRNLPIPPDDLDSYPFPFRLAPLSSDSLAQYVTAESPYPLPDSFSSALKAEVMKIIEQATRASGARTLGHVGTLYMKLYWLFQPSDTPAGPWKLPAAPFEGLGHLAQSL